MRGAREQCFSFRLLIVASESSGRLAAIIGQPRRYVSFNVFPPSTSRASRAHPPRTTTTVSRAKRRRF